MSCGSSGGIFPGVRYVFCRGMYTMLLGPSDRVNHPASRRDRGGRGRKRFPEQSRGGLETRRSPSLARWEEYRPSACVACKGNAAPVPVWSRGVCVCGPAKPCSSVQRLLTAC